MDATINNIGDLRMEISRLKGIEQEQASALGQRFNSPSATFSTIYSLFSRPAGAAHEKTSKFFEQDFVALLSRFLLPFTLNKTLFRNSNFIVKALVGVVSQKASHFINEGTVSGIWDKVKTVFNHKEKHEAPTPVRRDVPAFGKAYSGTPL